MELEQLRRFVAAAEADSFAQTARGLYTSRSTVSRAVSALEKELGLPLIQRRGGQQRLTAAGALLLTEGKALLTAADALTERVKGLREEEVQAQDLSQENSAGSA